MHDTTTLPSRKKSTPSAAILGNGKPARRKARHIRLTDSPESHEKLILAKVVAFRDGDFSARLPTDWDGVEGQIAEAFNQTIARKERILKEVTRLSATVGKEGRLNGSNEILRGLKILVVDDDARNIFALTSLLENQEMDVISATNGRSAIEIVTKTPDLSIVLMDIMMPEMDGYATIREIRAVPEFRTVPILALTAKAMQGDREKCLDAGASDYIAKPVNTDQLLSLMRMWLFR